jgi:hypothetical protein
MDWIPFGHLPPPGRDPHRSLARSFAAGPAVLAWQPARMRAYLAPMERRVVTRAAIRGFLEDAVTPLTVS